VKDRTVYSWLGVWNNGQETDWTAKRANTEVCRHGRRWVDKSRAQLLRAGLSCGLFIQ